MAITINHMIKFLIARIEFRGCWWGSPQIGGANFQGAPFNFHEGGPYQIETSPLVCSKNQWTGFYMTETSTVTVLSDIALVTDPGIGWKPNVDLGKHISS